MQNLLFYQKSSEILTFWTKCNFKNFSAPPPFISSIVLVRFVFHHSTAVVIVDSFWAYPKPLSLKEPFFLKQVQIRYMYSQIYFQFEDPKILSILYSTNTKIILVHKMSHWYMTDIPKDILGNFYTQKIMSYSRNLDFDPLLSFFQSTCVSVTIKNSMPHV